MSVELSLLQFSKRINNLIDKAVSAEQMKMIATMARQLIFNRAMLGKTLEGELTPRMPKFSAFYLAFRKVNTDSLHQRTVPSKSNVTFSGQLLDAIKVKSVTAKEAIIGVDDPRQPYKVYTLFPYKKPKKGSANPTIIKVGNKLYVKSKRKYTSKNKITNSQLLMYLAKKGRRIMGLSKAEQSQLVKEFRRQFTDLLAKI